MRRRPAEHFKRVRACRRCKRLKEKALFHRRQAYIPGGGWSAYAEDNDMRRTPPQGQTARHIVEQVPKRAKALTSARKRRTSSTDLLACPVSRPVTSLSTAGHGYIGYGHHRNVCLKQPASISTGNKERGGRWWPECYAGGSFKRVVLQRAQRRLAHLRPTATTTPSLTTAKVAPTRCAADAIAYISALLGQDALLCFGRANLRWSFSRNFCVLVFVTDQHNNSGMTDWHRGIIADW